MDIFDENVVLKFFYVLTNTSYNNICNLFEWKIIGSWIYKFNDVHQNILEL